MSYVNLGQIMYPVGSIFISTNRISPSNLFGGSWTRIEGAFVRGCKDTDLHKLGEFTGEDNHLLTIQEMPRHSHEVAWETPSFNDHKINTNLWFQLPYVWHNSPEEKVADGSSLGATGDSTPHNNVPRALQCIIWRRTA